MKSTIIYIIVLLTVLISNKSFSQFYVNDSINIFTEKKIHDLTISNILKDSVYGRIDINKAYIDNNVLVIEILYGAGCGSQFVKLIIDSLDKNKNYDTIFLKPILVNTGYCKAGGHAIIKFNIDYILKNVKPPFYINIKRYKKSILITD